MNYLLDTNVLSELVRENPHPHVVTFIHETDEDRFFLSVMSWAELRRGVALLPEGRKRTRLAQWLDHDLRERFAGRILPIDLHISDCWGQLMAKGKKEGRSPSVVDGFLAATAIVHNLQIVTRNEKDFVNLEVRLFNPWA